MAFKLINLNGNWNFFGERSNLGLKEKWHLKDEKTLASADVATEGKRLLQVPSCWNTADPFLNDYQGMIGWYKKHISIPARLKGKIIELVFEGANYETTLWINGKRVGVHEGGYTRFHFNVSKYVKVGKKNQFTIRVDNRMCPEERPLSTAMYYCFWNYGGIYRDLYLRIKNPLHFTKVRIDYDVNLINNQTQLKIQAPLSRLALGAKIVYSLKNKQNKTIMAGSVSVKKSATIQEIINNIRLWDIRAPYLYQLSVKLYHKNKLQDEYKLGLGFKKFEIRKRQFFLNGRRIKLWGVNRHEDYPGEGRAVSKASMEKDIKIFKQFGIYFVRTSHYPVSPKFIELCDKHGILVMEEAPFAQVGGDFTRTRPEQILKILPLCLQQIKAMIERDYNHVSVATWSVCNEVKTAVPALEKFVKALLTFAKRLDPQRPIWASGGGAVFSHKKRREEFGRRMGDVVDYHSYSGWHHGTIPASVIQTAKEFSRKNPTMPIIVGEFGAETVAGAHGKPTERGTEEFQAKLIKGYLEALSSVDTIQGGVVWCYADFMASPFWTGGLAHNTRWGTNPNVGMANKGIFAYDRTPKLAAYEFKKFLTRNKFN